MFIEYEKVILPVVADILVGWPKSALAVGARPLTEPVKWASNMAASSGAIVGNS